MSESEKNASSESSLVVKSKRRSLDAATETDLKLEEFILHLNNWLRMQPAWALVLARPRAERKRMAREVADAIFTAPHADTSEAFPRALRRSLGLR